MQGLLRFNKNLVLSLIDKRKAHLFLGTDSQCSSLYTSLDKGSFFRVPVRPELLKIRRIASSMSLLFRSLIPYSISGK